jgi:hypothetical protein
MKIIGYGEDSLTLWALKNRLGEILDKLGDTTPPSKCLAIYRPSFGRHGGASRSEFGEFDAIIGTHQATYLVESKREGSREIINRQIRFGEAQIRRHNIFAFYFNRWRDLQPSDWNTFSKVIRNDFKRKFNDKPIPRADRLLANNLLYVFSKLRCYNLKTINVLLFLHGPNFTSLPSKIMTVNFSLVSIQCNFLSTGGYVQL